MLNSKILNLQYECLQSPSLMRMMHIAYSLPIPKRILNFFPISAKFLNFPHYFRPIYLFCLIYVFMALRYFDHDALCIMLYSYWTPLDKDSIHIVWYGWGCHCVRFLSLQWL